MSGRFIRPIQRLVCNNVIRGGLMFTFVWEINGDVDSSVACCNV